MQRVYEEEDEADDAQDEADEELERRRKETEKAAAQPKPMDQVHCRTQFPVALQQKRLAWQGLGSRSFGLSLLSWWLICCWRSVRPP